MRHGEQRAPQHTLTQDGDRLLLLMAAYALGSDWGVTAGRQRKGVSEGTTPSAGAEGTGRDPFPVLKLAPTRRARGWEMQGVRHGVRREL